MLDLCSPALVAFLERAVSPKGSVTFKIPAQLLSKVLLQTLLGNCAGIRLPAALKSIGR